jgi:pyocin large subunit-like protein
LRAFCAFLTASLLAVTLSCGATASQTHAGTAVARDAGPGFRSPELLDEHYRKHGSEFGGINKSEYLHRARALRDAPLSLNVTQFVRDDGVITKFDRRSGAFGAYNPDRTIRTFFIPNDGERYFRRQARHNDRR